MKLRYIGRAVIVALSGAAIFGLSPERYVCPLEHERLPTPDYGWYYIVSDGEITRWATYPDQPEEGGVVAEVFFYAGTFKTSRLLFTDTEHVHSEFIVYEKKFPLPPSQAQKKWWPVVRDYAVRSGLLPSDLPSAYEPKTTEPYYLWFGAAGNVLLSGIVALFALEGVMAVSRLGLRRYRRRKGCCVVCGYDLRGRRQSGCPECGSGRD